MFGYVPTSVLIGLILLALVLGLAAGLMPQAFEVHRLREEAIDPDEEERLLNEEGDHDF